MRRRGFFIAAMTLSAVLGGGGCSRTEDLDGNAKMISSNTAVEGLTARCDVASLGLKDVPTLTVPKEYVPKILDLFRPAKPQPLPGGVAKIMELRIAGRDGQETRIMVYWYGKSPLIFDVDGSPYIRGGDFLALDGRDKYLDESLAIYGIFQRIEKLLQGAATPPDVDEQISLLRRSAGLEGK